MGKPHTKETLEDLRRRLYQRGTVTNEVTKHGLTDRRVDVSETWDMPEKQPPAGRDDLRTGAPMATVTESPVVETAEVAPQPKPRRKRRYRLFALLFSVLVLVGAVGAMSVFLWYGGNQISGNNIALSVNGPESIGGGEVVPLAIQVMNENAVPIESVTLILKYPEGTQSVDEPSRTLYEQRFPLDDLDPGEVGKVESAVSVYGEENTKKQIDATIEYRVAGSNGTFYKDAAPYVFTLTSAPLVLSVENVKQVASGQTVSVDLTVSSNASAPLQDILLTASYPTNFLFENAYPQPVFRDNVWRIDELEPEEEVTITIEGVVEGFSDDSFRVNFSAGRSSVDNQYAVSSTLAETWADFVIEQPFIDVVFNVSNREGSSRTIMVGNETDLFIRVNNTLDSTVYDMRVELVLEGNATNDGSVAVGGSQFDPRTQNIIWDDSINEALERVLPGDRREFKARIFPGPAETGSYYKAVANVFARRVSDPGAQEQLVGSSELDVRYSAPISIQRQLGRDTAGFEDSGPIPPVVGEVTTYSPTIVVESGANELVDATVEFEVPGYVEWIDEYEGDGTVRYNPVSRVATWDVGELGKRDRAELVFQIEFTPSYALVGTIPNVIGELLFRGTDNFSDKRVQDTAPPISSELSSEMGFPAQNGVVVD